MNTSPQNIVLDYLQIGAHVGKTSNDFLFMTDCVDKQIVLIEPVPYLYNELIINYEEKRKTNAITFLNIAISNMDGNLQLYVPSETNDFSIFPFWASQLASTNEDHIRSHIPELLVESITVPCFRLNTLIRNLNISHIEYLMVDTEGHDYDILMDLDLELLKPTTIQFENKHMDGIFSKNTKYTHLLEHFRQYSYTIVKEDDEDTIISLHKN